MTRASDLPKWRLALALAALFLSSMCTMGDLVISPIAANIYEAFADAPTALINLGVTGPALVGLPFGLAAGIMCDRMDKKKIMLAGFLVFTIASVFGIADVNVYYFVVMRLFATGVGWGITNTAALSILADLFADEHEHAKFVGWYNAAMSAIGACLASCAGMLATGGWTHAYSTYLAAIPVLVMLVILLPSFPARRQNEESSARAVVADGASAEPAVEQPDMPQATTAEQVEEVYGMSASSAAAMVRALFNSDRSGTSRPGWWHRLALLALQVFLVAMLYFVMLYLVGLYVADVNAGDAAFTGFLTSVMTVATALGSLVFGKAYKRMGNAVYLPALLVIGVAFFVLAFWPAPPVIAACLAGAGFMWPFYFCFFYTRCTEIVPEDKKSTSTSIVAAANGLAVSACSYLLTTATALTGGGCASAYPFFGMAMLIIATASAALWAAQRHTTRKVTDKAWNSY